jgi:hypothetical protein
MVATKRKRQGQTKSICPSHGQMPTNLVDHLPLNDILSHLPLNLPLENLISLKNQKKTGHETSSVIFSQFAPRNGPIYWLYPIIAFRMKGGPRVYVRTPTRIRKANTFAASRHARSHCHPLFPRSPEAEGTQLRDGGGGREGSAGGGGAGHHPFIYFKKVHIFAISKSPSTTTASSRAIRPLSTSCSCPPAPSNRPLAQLPLITCAVSSLPPPPLT